MSEPCSWHVDNDDCLWNHERWCLIEDMSIGDSPRCYRSIIEKLLDAPDEALDLLESVLDGEGTISVRRRPLAGEQVKVWTFEWTQRPTPTEPCAECGGSKEVVWVKAKDGGPDVMTDCPTCNGTGKREEGE